MQTFTAGGQCAANFVFQEGTDVYLGQAAHCAGTGGQTETDGCTSGSLPLGTPVGDRGHADPGRSPTASWVTMRSVGEADPDTCAYNDFALIRIDPGRRRHAGIELVAGTEPFEPDLVRAILGS